MGETRRDRVHARSAANAATDSTATAGELKWFPRARGAWMQWIRAVRGGTTSVGPNGNGCLATDAAATGVGADARRGGVGRSSALEVAR